MQRTIIIACDSFLALRNVRNSELGTRLSKEGFRVEVLVDPHQLSGSISAKVPDIDVNTLIDFNPNDYQRLAKYLHWMSWSRRSFKDPGTYLSKLEYRLANRRFFKHASKLSLVIGWLMGAIGLFRIFQQAALTELRQTPEYNQYTSRLKKNNPSLVAGFSPEGYREMVLLQAAADIGIPTLIMIRSRDNLVSKISFMPKVDQYLTWSENQRSYFYHLYPDFKNLPVKVVGSPQFCRHHDESSRLRREEFFLEVGLDFSKPLVTFCLENPAIVPHQGNMAAALAEAFERGKIRRNAQLLIRNHPRAFGSDYDPLNGKKFSSVKVYPKPNSIPFGKHDSEIVKLILDDEPMHLATMAYQDVNVNIMSTVIIDSAIFDKPIINVGFDLPGNISKSKSVIRFFQRTDYKIVEKTGATEIANSLSELVDFINHYLDNPQDKSRERALLVEEDIGILGQQSNELLSGSLIKAARIGKKI